MNCNAWRKDQDETQIQATDKAETKLLKIQIDLDSELQELGDHSRWEYVKSIQHHECFWGETVQKWASYLYNSLYLVLSKITGFFALPPSVAIQSRYKWD